ncbi:hypothetical protein C8R44DRAFT_931746 [Mycena epipterygia]|nr:hypothetical protein C8R44DRAFT_931746 [Mycena epipterygia]
MTRLSCPPTLALAPLFKALFKSSPPFSKQIAQAHLAAIIQCPPPSPRVIRRWDQQLVYAAPCEADAHTLWVPFGESYPLLTHSAVPPSTRAPRVDIDISAYPVDLCVGMHTPTTPARSGTKARRLEGLEGCSALTRVPAHAPALLLRAPACREASRTWRGTPIGPPIAISRSCSRLSFKQIAPFFKPAAAIVDDATPHAFHVVCTATPFQIPFPIPSESHHHFAPPSSFHSRHQDTMPMPLPTLVDAIAPIILAAIAGALAGTLAGLAFPRHRTPERKTGLVPETEDEEDDDESDEETDDESDETDDDDEPDDFRLELRLQIAKTRALIEEHEAARRDRAPHVSFLDLRAAQREERERLQMERERRAVNEKRKWGGVGEDEGWGEGGIKRRGRGASVRESGGGRKEGGAWGGRGVAVSRGAARAVVQSDLASASSLPAAPSCPRPMWPPRHLPARSRSLRPFACRCTTLRPARRARPSRAKPRPRYAARDSVLSSNHWCRSSLGRMSGAGREEHGALAVGPVSARGAAVPGPMWPAQRVPAVLAHCARSRAA